MSETNDQMMEKSGADANGDGVNGEISVTDKKNANNLKIDATISASDDESDFVSPRQLILEAKSSEEEITVSKSKVASRHKWIEETLLKDQVKKKPARNSLPANASAPFSQRTAKNATTPSRASLSPRSTGDDVLARARKAIEGRRKSREVAKAKVSADVASIGDEPGVSTSHAAPLKDDAEATKEAKLKAVSEDTNTTEKEAGAKDATTQDSNNNTGGKPSSKENDVKAKAKERLNATMALLAANSLRKKAVKSEVKETRQMNETEVGDKALAEDKVEKAFRDRTSKEETKASKDEKSPTDSQRQKEAQAEAVRLEQERLEAEVKKKADLERLEKERIEQERLLAKKEEEILAKQKEEEGEAKRLAEVQAKAENLKRDRLAADAAKQAEIERRIELHEKKMKQAQAKRQEQEKMAAEAAKQAELEKRIEEQEQKIAKSKAGRQEQPRSVSAEALAELERLEEEQTKRDTEEAMCKEEDVGSPNNEPSHLSFDAINFSSSSYNDTAPLLKMHSEATSDATSMGQVSQVDRILYQGKGIPDKQQVDKTEEGLQQEDEDEDFLQQDVSDEEEDALYYEAVALSESGSQYSNIAPNSDSEDLCTDLPPVKGGRLWQEAAFETALKKDFLPRETPSSSDVIDSSTSEVKDGNYGSTVHQDPTNLTHKKSSRDVHRDIEAAESHYECQDDDVWLDEALTNDQDGVSNEWKGFKRDRMIFVLALGILAGLFPSLYSQTTCHFITGEASVGEDEIEFGLYYGLNKFTPIDSAFQGYNYCQPYDSKYNYNPPSIPRAVGIAATIFGTIPLIVIGAYIQFSMTHKILWIGSMWMLYLGFVCQISTLSIFLLDLCQDGIECSMGPGAWMAGVCSITWFILSIEMKINSPLIQPVKSDGVVVIEKDSRFMAWMKKLWQRINGEDVAPSLSRTAMKMQKERIGKGDTELGRYRPPEVV